MKKIAFILGTFGNTGQERVTWALAHYMSENSHEVHAIVLKGFYRDFYVDNSIKIHVIDELGHYDFEHSCNSFVEIINNIMPDCIISLGFGYDHIIQSKALEKFRIILSERNDPKVIYNTKKSRDVAEYVYSKASHVVFQTQQAMDFFNLSVKEHSSIIPNPLIPNLPKRHIGVRRKVFVNYCRFHEQKNLPLLIEAYNKVHCKYPEFTLELYGRGDLKDNLVSYTKSLGLESKVIFNDFMKDIHYKILDAYAFVSSSDYEGISNSMIEALAIGLPCISTNCPVGGAADFIINFHNGILVPIKDADALAIAMIKLIENEDLARSFSERSVDICNNLSIENIGSKWMSLLE